MRSIRIALGLFALMLAGSGQAMGQQARVVGPEALDAAVVGKADVVEHERDRLRALLERAEVGEVAQAHGIDIEKARDAVGTLNATELQWVSPLVQAITGDLVGGQNITLTATTLIIILLLVILLIMIT